MFCKDIQTLVSEEKRECENVSYRAIAVPDNELNPPGKPWETGMDHNCEFPEPTHTPATVDGISIHGGHAGCGSVFEVRAKVVSDLVGVEGVEVEFEYKTIKKTTTTDSNGEAKAKFDYQGAYGVLAKAGSYGEASLTAEHSDDCPAGEEPEGEVLGITTETAGAVLGTSTMADTGTTDDLIGLVFTAGALMTTLGLRPYKTKKS